MGSGFEVGLCNVLNVYVGRCEGKSLFWVAVLGLILMYLFAIGAFLFLREIFMHAGGNFFYCYHMYECIVSVVWLGLTGQLFELYMSEDEKRRYFLTVLAIAAFHIAFFLIITVIALNAIFGIIVDTFSELRDLKVHLTSALIYLFALTLRFSFSSISTFFYCPFIFLFGFALFLAPQGHIGDIEYTFPTKGIPFNCK